MLKEEKEMLLPLQQKLNEIPTLGCVILVTEVVSKFILKLFC